MVQMKRNWWAGAGLIGDENCIGVGYLFPANRPMFRFDSTGPL
jgi:hypothetical protein